MITVIEHGSVYRQREYRKVTREYKCSYCGCRFTATLNDFVEQVVGHGEMDYVTKCPECNYNIFDRINRV